MVENCTAPELLNPVNDFPSLNPDALKVGESVGKCVSTDPIWCLKASYASFTHSV